MILFHIYVFPFVFFLNSHNTTLFLLVIQHNGRNFLSVAIFESSCRTSQNPLTGQYLQKMFKRTGHQGAVRGHGSKPTAWPLKEEQGGAATVLTGVRVSLLGPERTGSEGELALHGRLGFPFLPQQFTPVQLRSFGERGQLVFALLEVKGEIKKTEMRQRCGHICKLRVCVNNSVRTVNKLRRSY